ncbi:zinc finger protein CONSTANS-LIKE 5 isoform X2 [Malus domestica]|uniref:zinc finger protein CONSTANS-LIKE 5 isoform X2 n=1 Tax=Malus domestica TaxID=3750 RepID=UPI00049883C4|nr:zinc finger protein CONSTANS-LIKE 5 isoform X2 [Malus domestica]
MGLQGGWSAPAVGLVAKLCDSCKNSTAALFCRADLVFLCLPCDARIHAANKLTTRHERVWMCEVCDQAPAAVTCKADAAALCVACDADIHSANPLARRHERVPVEPFYDSAESIIVKSTAAAPSSAGAAINYLVPNGDVLSKTKDVNNDPASNWLIPNPNFNSKLQMDIAPDITKSSGDLFFPEMDLLLELDYPNSIHTISGPGTDGVVPVQTDPIPPPSLKMNHNISGPADQNCFDMDFCSSKFSSSFSYPTQSLSQSMSELFPTKTPYPIYRILSAEPPATAFLNRAMYRTLSGKKPATTFQNRAIYRTLSAGKPATTFRNPAHRSRQPLRVNQRLSSAD